MLQVALYAIYGFLRVAVLLQNPKVRYGESAEIDTCDVQGVLLGQQTQIGYFFVSQERNDIGNFLVQQILDFAIKNASTGSRRRCQPSDGRLNPIKTHYSFNISRARV